MNTPVVHVIFFKSQFSQMLKLTGVWLTVEPQFNEPPYNEVLSN